MLLFSSLTTPATAFLVTNMSAITNITAIAVISSIKVVYFVHKHFRSFANPYLRVVGLNIDWS